MKHVWIFLGLCVAGLCGLSPRPQTAAGQSDADRPPALQLPVMVVCVRHAEKADPKAADPGLSEAGLARAKALARLLQAAKVTHLYASNFARTRQTLEALAQERKLVIEARDAKDVEGLAKEIAGLAPGSLVVVAGHSNTLPALIDRLGGRIGEGEKSENLGEGEYDRMFVVTLGEGVRTSIVEFRYGEP